MAAAAATITTTRRISAITIKNMQVAREQREKKLAKIISEKSQFTCNEKPKDYTLNIARATYTPSVARTQSLGRCATATVASATGRAVHSCVGVLQQADITAYVHQAADINWPHEVASCAINEVAGAAQKWRKKRSATKTKNYTQEAHCVAYWKADFCNFLKITFFMASCTLHHHTGRTTFSTKPFSQKHLLFKATHRLFVFCLCSFFGSYFRIAGDKFELPARTIESQEICNHLSGEIVGGSHKCHMRRLSRMWSHVCALYFTLTTKLLIVCCLWSLRYFRKWLSFEVMGNIGMKSGKKCNKICCVWFVYWALKIEKHLVALLWCEC